MNWLKAKLAVISYIKSRLKEKSTLVGIASAIAAGGVIPAPYSYYVIAAGIAAVFIPETPKNVAK